MDILELWLLCALFTVLLHLLPALIIDRRLALGTWTRIGLAFFFLLGPLGLLLECWLLSTVLQDILGHLAETAGNRRHRERKPAVWNRIAGRHL
ncbi:hypothetical protein JCM30471_21250 [Desulfuromonas carbonis]|uniref:hypothetical protein n=1 Tax=Desulfuromonas sp. DDH964 TaxID=1823759 RepID=UPI00078C920A|nr:hypothetical protein [Desulfuromonas sp. DDH964]AMV73706.1 hypothetical protein DBW_3408 [Desulfuromonas sp. DDH964]